MKRKLNMITENVILLYQIIRLLFKVRPEIIKIVNDAENILFEQKNNDYFRGINYH